MQTPNRKIIPANASRPGLLAKGVVAHPHRAAAAQDCLRRTACAERPAQNGLLQLRPELELPAAGPQHPAALSAEPTRLAAEERPPLRRAHGIGRAAASPILGQPYCGPAGHKTASPHRGGGCCCARLDVAQTGTGWLHRCRSRARSARIPAPDDRQQRLSACRLPAAACGNPEGSSSRRQ